MNAAACPTEARLRKFHDGSLADPDLEAVATHLAGCSACEAAISRIEAAPPTDPLQAGFRALKSGLLSTAVDQHRLLMVAPPRQCGRYEIREHLGTGGMGFVYRAWDPELKRFAAVKVLRSGTAARPDELSRFHREAELLARLRHPNLVDIYEAGTQDGQAYLAMELVTGGSLADRIDRSPLAPRTAAKLVRDVARAVQVAHLGGVTHRDIKPANLLLQGDGPDTALQPKLSDFGLARLDDPATRLTETGVGAGTPAYMAPEQADPRIAPIGPPADVWALGAVLYECLTGHVPFEGGSVVEVLSRLLNTDPVPPAGVPRDLVVVCLKCLRKAPAERYRTAGELADDLDRFLAGEPVWARPVGALEAGWKWAKRRPWVAGLTASLVAVTLAGTIGIVLALIHALAGWNAADRRELEAIAARDRAEQELYYSRVAQSELRWRANDVRAATALLGACPRERRGWEWQYLDGLLHSAVARADADLAGDSWHSGAGYVDDLTFTTDGTRLLTAGGGNPFSAPSATGPASIRVWNPQSGVAVGLPLMAGAGLRAIAVSPDGGTAAALERTGIARQWSIADGREKSATAGLPPLGRLWYRPNGCLRLVGCRSIEEPAHGIRVEGWDVSASKLLWAFEVAGAVVPAWVGPIGVGGGRVAATLIDEKTGTNRVVALDGESGKQVADFVVPAQVSAVALSSDGSRLAVHADALRLYELSDGRMSWLSSLPAVANTLAFSPDGTRLAAGLADRTVRTFSTDTGTPQGIWRGHAGRVSCVAFPPDGRRLAAGTEQEGEWAIWDLTRPQECVLVNVGTGRSPEAIGFSAAGQNFVVVTPERPVRLLDPATGAFSDGPTVPISTKWQAPATLAVLAADATVLVCVGPEPDIVTVCDRSNGTVRARLTGLGAPIRRVVASADGSRVAALGVRRVSDRPLQLKTEVRVWEVQTGRILVNLSLPVGYPVGALAMTGDGSRVAFTDTPDDAIPADGTDGLRSVRVRVWNIAENRELWAATCLAPVWSLTFDGTSQRLAAGDMADHVLLWNTATGRSLTSAALAGPGYALAFSPDGQRLAGADRERVRLWDPATGAEVLDLGGVPARSGDDGYNPQLAWSADGRRLAAIRSRGQVAIWDSQPARATASK